MRNFEYTYLNHCYFPCVGCIELAKTSDVDVILLFPKNLLSLRTTSVVNALQPSCRAMEGRVSRNSEG